VTPATLVGDIGGGAMYLVAGMLAGLLRAGRTGQGRGRCRHRRRLGAHAGAPDVDGARRHAGRTRGESLLDGPHWSRSYACADGGFVSVQCLEAKFYAEFLAVLDLSAPTPTSRASTTPPPGPAPRAAGRLFAASPRPLGPLFAGTDACVAPVLSPWEAAGDPHLAARATWVEPAGALQPAPAPAHSAPPPAPAAIPARDAHRAEILADLRARGPRHRDG
jgi:alpha-methylacyl-CoA racemase